MKALGIQVSDLAMFREVELVAGSGGGYEVKLQDRLKAASEERGVRRINVTIGCNANNSGAVIILES
jgi:phosphopantetheinyl transferase (holo-ACP synthase)